MPKTIVVGDSVALGIGQAIPRSMISAEGNLRIDQMQNYFNSAIATAESGDTVIVSAGYNSTGPNGISTEDLTRLQGWVNQLHTKGARVVIAPLRETGMTGDYAHLNGQTAITNRQLRTLTNVTVADQCVATANGIPGGEIHGAYPDLARICQASAAASTAVTASPAAGTGTTTNGGNPSAEADNAQANRNSGGIGDFFRNILTSLSQIPIIGGLFRAIGNLFGLNIPEPAATTTTAAAAGTGGTTDTQTTPDERTRAAALAAANGNSAAGTGTDVASVAPTSLPAARGPLVRVAG